MAIFDVLKHFGAILDFLAILDIFWLFKKITSGHSDYRIYKNQEDDDSHYLKTVTEDRMSRNNSFKDFLNASFSSAADKKTSKVSQNTVVEKITIY